MLNKQEFYEKNVWPRWIDEIRKLERPIIFLHGIMGSQLYDDKSQDTIWLDAGLWHEIDNLEVEKLTPSGLIDSQGQFIYARSTVKWPWGDDYYDKILHNKTFRVERFNFDWRESIPIEAKRLEIFLSKLLHEIDDKKISFVSHSMGGCVLLRLLGKNNAFDARIDKIIFCAPPFHGALKPLRVIEDGNGTPADFLINDSILKHTAVTLTGLFNLLVAPQDQWITNLPNLNITLQYPIRDDKNLYRPSAWTNDYDIWMLTNNLNFASIYHKEKRSMISEAVKRLGSKMHVIVGLNGKTDYAAVWREEYDHWTVHKTPEPPKGKISNGDGTVLFQSSYLPGLPLENYWAYIPQEQEDSHGEIVNLPEVTDGINALLNNQIPQLKRYNEFINLIDWTQEAAGASTPKFNQHLDYHERARMRVNMPIASWGKALNPNGDDAALFNATRVAALQVLQGKDLKSAAELIGKDEDFLKNYMKSMLMPVCFG